MPLENVLPPNSRI